LRFSEPQRIFIGEAKDTAKVSEKASLLEFFRAAAYLRGEAKILQGERKSKSLPAKVMEMPTFLLLIETETQYG
jgi:hypothetical protein